MSRLLTYLVLRIDVMSRLQTYLVLYCRLLSVYRHSLVTWCDGIVLLQCVEKEAQPGIVSSAQQNRHVQRQLL